MKSVLHRCIQLLLVMVGIVGSFAAQAAYEFTNIDPPGATFTEVFGINNSGQVVGGSQIGTVNILFLYDSKKGSFTTLPPAAGPTGLLGISESGVMVGSSNDGTFESGLIRSKKGVYTSFSHPDCDNTFGRAISNTGMVSGFANDCSASDFVGFIYDPVSNLYIDFLPSPRTIAQGINNRGQVVGNVQLGGGVACGICPAGHYGFLRASGGAITYFRVNNSGTSPRGITDSGLITGFFFDSISGASQGFVAMLTGLPYEPITIAPAQFLEVPGAVSTLPEGINDLGQIVGLWNDALGQQHGFIATPVPPKKK